MKASLTLGSRRGRIRNSFENGEVLGERFVTKMISHFNSHSKELHLAPSPGGVTSPQYLPDEVCRGEKEAELGYSGHDIRAALGS